MRSGLVGKFYREDHDRDMLNPTFEGTKIYLLNEFLLKIL